MTSSNPIHELVQAQLDVAFGIRVAVCKISEKRPSVERCIIDQYLRFISPTMAAGKGVEFPRTCRRHPLNPEKCAEGGSISSLLNFHIGNAILGFYDLLGLHATNETEEIAQTRVDVLQAIAKHGLHNFTVVGDDATGYGLQHLAFVRAAAENNYVPSPA